MLTYQVQQQVAIKNMMMSYFVYLPPQTFHNSIKRPLYAVINWFHCFVWFSSRAYSLDYFNSVHQVTFSEDGTPSDRALWIGPMDAAAYECLLSVRINKQVHTDLTTRSHNKETFQWFVALLRFLNIFAIALLDPTFFYWTRHKSFEQLAYRQSRF